MLLGKNLNFIFLFSYKLGCNCYLRECGQYDGVRSLLKYISGSARHCYCHRISSTAVHELKQSPEFVCLNLFTKDKGCSYSSFSFLSLILTRSFDGLPSRRAHPINTQFPFFSLLPCKKWPRAFSVAGRNSKTYTVRG